LPGGGTASRGDTVLSARRGAPEIRALTSLRGLAALTVVAYHASDAAGADLVPRGYLAVDLFFVLSGFVLALTASADVAARGLRAAPPFWVRRVARILPLNLAVVAALTAANLAAHGGAGVPVARVACNALALQGLGWCVSLNAPAWTLSVEWLAYLLFPALLLAVVRTGPGSNALSAALAAVAALGGLLALAVHAGRGSLDSVPCGAVWSLVRCLSETVLGVLAHRAFAREATRRVWSRDSAAAGIGVLALCGAAPGRYGLPGGDLWLALTFPLLVLALAANDGVIRRLLGLAPLHMLGLISFSMYLLHDALLQREARLADGLWPGWRSAAGAPWFVLLATASVAPPAWLAWRLVERPGRSLLTREERFSFF
jgi:peptidoglycan/LPS O-acetylase OafA/YrhL